MDNAKALKSAISVCLVTLTLNGMFQIMFRDILHNHRNILKIANATGALAGIIFFTLRYFLRRIEKSATLTSGIS
jgi:hypothetical protein